MGLAGFPSSTKDMSIQKFPPREKNYIDREFLRLKGGEGGGVQREDKRKWS